jgi:hypothetical protein
MDVSDIISIISIIISTGTTFFVVWFTKYQNRKNTLMHMHQLWSSEFYRKCRINAYSGIRNRISKGRKVLYSNIEDSEIELSLGTVEHFFADIYHLLKEGDIDPKLTKILFSSTIEAYFRDVFDHIDYDIEFEKNFFDESIKPLKEIISAPTPSKPLF